MVPNVSAQEMRRRTREVLVKYGIQGGGFGAPRKRQVRGTIGGSECSES